MSITTPDPESLVVVPVRILCLPLDAGRSVEIRHPIDLDASDIDLIVDILVMLKNRLLARAKADAAAE